MKRTVPAKQFSPSSRSRLTHHDLGRFGGSTLFDRIGRAVCEAGCLPRKELFEAWEVARRSRRLLEGGRVVDVAGGHGLLAHIMLILDDTSAEAMVVDPVEPPSARAIHDVLARTWPRLNGRVSHSRREIQDFAMRPEDAVVSCHACGALTDRIIDAAVAARARLAVLPCCHDTETCDAGDLTGWMDSSLAIDASRVARLKVSNYQVRTQTIPADITPKNRLIIAWPGPGPNATPPRA